MKSVEEINVAINKISDCIIEQQEMINDFTNEIAEGAAAGNHSFAVQLNGIEACEVEKVRLRAKIKMLKWVLEG